ncbi:MAG: hypothetical protein IPJ09_21125 [Saprospiraceae bacterium]|nr:hypothetical protein [Saprospiraceae bacterium]
MINSAYVDEATTSHITSNRVMVIGPRAMGTSFVIQAGFYREMEPLVGFVSSCPSMMPSSLSILKAQICETNDFTLGSYIAGHQRWPSEKDKSVQERYCNSVII